MSEHDRLESLHRLALDYRTAQDYPATKKAWAELEAYVLHLARGHEAAEHGLALLNEAWGAVPARYQAPAVLAEPDHPLPKAVKLMARDLDVSTGGTG